MSVRKWQKILIAGLFVLGGGWATRTLAASTPLDPGFSYQGRVSKNGIPTTGKCDFKFSLWDAPGSGTPPAGGAQFGTTQTLASIDVANGLFSVILNRNKEFHDSAGNSPFYGQKCWLNLAVRYPAGSGNYTTIGPRQELMAAPYALSFQPGATVVNNQPATGWTYGLWLDSLFGTPLRAVAHDANHAGIQVDQLGAGDGLYASTQATSVSGKAAIRGENKSDGIGIVGKSASGTGIWGQADVTTTGNVIYIAGVHGESTNQTGVYGHSSKGVGIYGSSYYSEGIRGASTYAYGIHGYGQYYEGVLGESVQTYGVTGVSQLSSGVRGMASSLSASGVYGDHTTSGTGVMGRSRTNGIGVKGQAGAASGVAPGVTNGIGVLGDSSHGPGVVGLSNASTGLMFGVMGTHPSGIGVYGYTTTGSGIKGLSNEGSGASGTSTNGPGVQGLTWNGNLFLGTQLSRLGIMTISKDKFRVDGAGKVNANGGFEGSGGNVAERITVSDATAPHPGDLVEIDPNNPGQFRLTTTSNSKLVAGVITTTPAVAMNNPDPANATPSTQPLLAVAGRVMVKATASNGVIQPGDMLVSSLTAGTVMKAPTSPAVGTVVGKALGSLSGSDAQIEMLVMLR